MVISIQPAASSESQLPLDVPYPPLNQETERKAGKVDGQVVEKEARKKGGGSVEEGGREPRYRITHRGEFTMQDYTNDRVSDSVRRPRELVVSIELPGVVSVTSTDNLD